MASMANLNSTSLGEMLQRSISDAVVLVAKNIILGNQPAAIAGLLGVSEDEVNQLMETGDYKDCHLILASHHNANAMAVDFTYDDIEQAAIQKLATRIERETDTDKLIRIATLANRAVRRVDSTKKSDPTLDPSRAGNQVRITLSRRMIEKLQNGATREETQQISIKGGHVNPSFEQVDQFLGGIAKPRLPENYRPASELDTNEISLEALMREIDK